MSSQQNFLFGNGFGSFKYNFPFYQAEILRNHKEFNFINTSYVHNDYLHILTETGLIGLILFLFFIFFLFFVYEKTTPFLSKQNYLLTTACFVSLIAILIESFFNFPLFILPSALIFYLIAGILYASINAYLNSYLFKLKIIFINIFILALILFTLFLKPFDYISNFYLNHGINLTLKFLPKDRDYIDKAIKLNPHNFFNYFFMGNAFASIKKYEDAIKYYKKCLDIYPYSSDILYNIGVMFRSIKDYKNAEEFFKKALNLYPDFPDAHFHLGKIYQKQGKNDLADKEFFTVNRLNPYLIEKELSKSVVLFTETTYNLIK